MLCYDACMGMRMRASEEAHEKGSVIVIEEIIECHLISSWCIQLHLSVQWWMGDEGCLGCSVVREP